MRVTGPGGAEERFESGGAVRRRRQELQGARVDPFDEFRSGREREFLPCEVERRIDAGCGMDVLRHRRDALAAELHEIAVRDAEEKVCALDRDAFMELREL